MASMPTSNLHRNDWCFIDKYQYGCPEDEKPYLLEYEYARESDQRGLASVSAPTWRRMFGDRFPLTPFLSIDPIERRKLIKETFKEKIEEGVGKLPPVDFTKPRQSLTYRYSYSLKPRYQSALESLVEGLCDEPGFTAYRGSKDGAVSEFNSSLSTEAYDESVADVYMTIDFDSSDEKLKDEFMQMLRAIRRTKHKSSKHLKIDAKLTRLAAARLCHVFGTPEKARSYAFDQGYEIPYEDDSGWSRPRKEVRQELACRALPKGPE